MINLRCAAWRAGMVAATQFGKLAGRRPGIIRVLVVALITASTGVAAGPAWVAVAASPDMRILVDAGSVTKNSRGVIDLWTKTRYASPQTATGIQYAADMTRFALDCAAARYGITGGKFLDAQGKVLRQFDEPAAELEPIPVASKIDAVARAVCPMGRGTWRGK